MEEESRTRRLTRREKRLLRQGHQQKENFQEKVNFKLKHIDPLTENQKLTFQAYNQGKHLMLCLLYTSPSPRDRTRSRMPSSA